MKGWSKTRLSDLVEIKHGYAFKGEYFTDEPSGTVLLTPGNFAIGGGFQLTKLKYYRDGPVPPEYVLHEGDLLVTMTDLSKAGDTLGYSAAVPLTNQVLLHNQRLGKIITKTDAIDAKFLHWRLRSQDYRNEVLASFTGSTVKHTSPGRIGAFEFDLPPLPEQRAIAATLGALDDKIELNRRTCETLEAMARALFRDWFVDFGPTRAKMAGAIPYLSPDLWSLFPDRLDDAGKPEGWEVGTMSDLFTLQRGFDLPSQDRVEGKFPILAASGPSGFHSIHMVKGPGVTTGRSGVLGRVFFVHDDFWPLNTSLWVKEYKRATPSFAYFFLRLIDLAGFNAGSAVPTLNRNHVHGLPAVIPPKGLVEAFDVAVCPLLMRQRQAEKENETLAQTRDLLLSGLMSGELQVSEHIAPRGGS